MATCIHQIYYTRYRKFIKNWDNLIYFHVIQDIKFEFMNEKIYNTEKFYIFMSNLTLVHKRIWRRLVDIPLFYVPLSVISVLFFFLWAFCNMPYRFHYKVSVALGSYTIQTTSAVFGDYVIQILCTVLIWSVLSAVMICAGAFMKVKP